MKLIFANFKYQIEPKWDSHKLVWEIVWIHGVDGGRSNSSYNYKNPNENENDIGNKIKLNFEYS